MDVKLLRELNLDRRTNEGPMQAPWVSDVYMIYSISYLKVLQTEVERSFNDYISTSSRALHDSSRQIVCGDNNQAQKSLTASSPSSLSISSSEV